MIHAMEITEHQHITYSWFDTRSRWGTDRITTKGTSCDLSSVKVPLWYSAVYFLGFHFFHWGAMHLHWLLFKLQCSCYDMPSIIQNILPLHHLCTPILMQISYLDSSMYWKINWGCQEVAVFFWIQNQRGIKWQNI